MNRLIVGLLFLVSARASAVENIFQFNELFMERTCRLAGQAAADRARDIAKGSGIYDGDIAAYKGQKVIRVIQVARNCEAVMTDVGMQYQYWLTIQTETK